MSWTEMEKRRKLKIMRCCGGNVDGNIYVLQGIKGKVEERRKTVSPQVFGVPALHSFSDNFLTCDKPTTIREGPLSQNKRPPSF